MEGKVKAALKELEDFALFVICALEADIDYVKASIKEINLVRESKTIDKSTLQQIVTLSGKIKYPANLIINDEQISFFMCASPNISHPIFSPLRAIITNTTQCRDLCNSLELTQLKSTLTNLVKFYENYVESICKASTDKKKDMLQPPVEIYIEQLKGQHFITTQQIARSVISMDEYKYLSKPYVQGTHIVTDRSGVHFKTSNDQHPINPSVEHSIFSFFKLFAGGITPSCLLQFRGVSVRELEPVHVGKFNSYILEGKKAIDYFTEYPEAQNHFKIVSANFFLQASKTVKGELLKNFLEEVKDKGKTLECINSYNFSSMALCSILTNPSDGKYDNYMVTTEPGFSDIDELQKLENKKEEMSGKKKTATGGNTFIIGIDNDMAFTAPITRAINSHHAGVKCILYFFQEFMTQPIHASIAYQLVTIPPKVIAMAWMFLLLAQEINYNTMAKECNITKKEFRLLGLPLCFVQGTVLSISSSIAKLHSMVIKNANITHNEVLLEMEPLLGLYYKTVMENNKNDPIDSIRAVYGSTSVEQVLKTQLDTKLANALASITIREPELVERSTSSLSDEFFLLNLNSSECKEFLDWWVGAGCLFDLPKMFIANLNLAELIPIMIPQTLRKLLEQAPQLVNMRNKTGELPLHSAVKLGKTEPKKAEEIIDILLKLGADEKHQLYALSCAENQSLKILTSSPILRSIWEREDNITLEEKRARYARNIKVVKGSDIVTWNNYTTKLDSSAYIRTDVSISNKPQHKEWFYNKFHLPKPNFTARWKVDPVLNTKVAVWTGDITTLEVDAILNTTNISLKPFTSGDGGGVDEAIHRVAGPKLLAECDLLEGCNTGQAKIMQGYNLPAKYVIATVGAVGEIPEILYDAYHNSLEVAKKHNIRTLALCGVSTGSHCGYPLFSASHIALATTREWLDSNKDKVDKIIFCTYRKTEALCYEHLMSIYFPR